LAYRVTVDTGGTFTDVVIADGAGRLVVGKAPTTPARIFEGMRAAIDATAGELGLGLEALLADTEILIYGTTRATNAIVEKTVAKTALLLTEGFPNILVLTGSAEDETLAVDEAATRAMRAERQAREQPLTTTGAANLDSSARTALSLECPGATP
jgi:N-methylhydantoinase A/oxoprolinase/acetone carboxylase beta subunit